MTDRPRLHYLTLESPREGQASYAHVHEIIAGLRKIGWQVDLYAPGYAEGWERPGIVGRMLEYVRVQKRLWDALGEGDAIYMRSHPLAFPLAWAAKRKGVPVVQEINGPYEDIYISYKWMKPLGWLMVGLWKSQYRWAGGIVTVTEQLKNWVLKQIGDGVVEVIPNGANTDMFTPDAACELELPKPYALFFGGLARWQGIPTLLAAAEHPAWPKGVKLVIVGDGQERAAVDDAAACNPVIHYVGRQPYKIVPGIIANSLCGLVPKNKSGDREGTGLFPLKVFETLAGGVPAVVSDFPGQGDLVREFDCGVPVPAEEPEALAQAVADLAADPEKATAMGRRGREAIVAAHSWNARAEQTGALIEKVSRNAHEADG